MGERSHLDGRTLVLFDGDCGFCNRTVRWALRRDRGDRLRFAAFGSPRIQDLISPDGPELRGKVQSPSTVMVIREPGGSEEKVCVRSDAVVALLEELPWPWPGISAILAAIPRPLRDLGYRFIAARRHRMGGRLAHCPVPTSAERARFL